MDWQYWSARCSVWFFSSTQVSSCVPELYVTLYVFLSTDVTSLMLEQAASKGSRAAAGARRASMGRPGISLSAITTLCRAARKGGGTRPARQGAATALRRSTLRLRTIDVCVCLTPSIRPMRSSSSSSCSWVSQRRKIR
ncbi:hypothetical protein G6F40_016552 [Rhizopus arrhizus]|nr:hypothetical protein G6F40_016552 [Rhizopus arrhizus]